jgi:hypothetical protein
MFLLISTKITLCKQSSHHLASHGVCVLFAGLCASFASSAQKPVAVQYWMDVATLTVSGITNTALSQDAISTDALGQLTGNTGSQFGGTKGMQPGRWLDVALAVPAEATKATGGALTVRQIIPKGQNMGESLPLARTPSPFVSSPSSRQTRLALRGPDIDDKSIEAVKFVTQSASSSEAIENNAPKKLLLYWGCGERVRAGQPRQLDMTTASSDSPATGLKGRAVAENGPTPDSGVAIWPNSASRSAVPKEASLVGKHAFTGDNIPANMQFELKAKQDFMPALAINVNGIKGSATTLNWSRIATAQAYFLMATSKNKREMIIWTSSEQPEPGWGLMDYASNANLAQWKRDKIVLAPNQTSCSIPAGIFSQTGGAMLNGIAYGEETNINSRNTSGNSSGNGSWNARIRVKSATMQPFDEFNAAQLVASPNASSTIIRTSSLDFPGSSPGLGSGTPGTEETLNRLLIQVPVSKPPKCDPCKRPGEL